jgi:hypothetical protein
MDNVDLDNLSTDMALGGKLALPVGVTDFTVKELLERYKPDDSLFHVDVDSEGLVMLYVEELANYEVRELSTKFDTLIDNVMKYSVETQPLNLEAMGFPVSLTLPLDTVVERTDTLEFDFNALNSNSNVQEISSILFRSTDVNVTVNTHGASYPEGFLLITMQLPGTNEYIVVDASQASSTETKRSLKIEMDKETTTSYTAKFKITGNGQTSIAANAQVGVSIAFKNSDYVVYGHFYYSEGKKQMQPYKVDLFSYLPKGNTLWFYAPSFKFNVSSNIGIPFIFDLDTITSYAHGETAPTYARVSLNEGNIIKRASQLGDPVSSTITVDKSSFPDGNASAIFNTNLSSISASYAFKAPERGSSLGAGDEQFIARDSWMKLTASAQLPIWLDTGSVVAYADTLDGIDVEKYDYITSAQLVFAYTSRLPLEFNVTVKLLDKDKKVIVTQPNRYDYALSAAEVDGEGNVSKPKEGKFSIDYDSNVINDLKKAKYLVVDVKATGAPSSKIKITNNDKLSIKAILHAEGGLTVNPD